MSCRYLVHEPSREGAMSTGLGALRVTVREVREHADTLQLGTPPPQSATVWALYNTQGPAWRPARVPLPVNWTFTVSSSES